MGKNTVETVSQYRQRAELHLGCSKWGHSEFSIVQLGSGGGARWGWGGNLLRGKADERHRAAGTNETAPEGRADLSRAQGVEESMYTTIGTRQRLKTLCSAAEERTPEFNIKP